MALSFAYPTTLELKEVEQNLLPTLTKDDMIFDHFPITEVDEWRLQWRQDDDFTGLQHVRGLGGEFKVVETLGMKSYDFEPGVYGDFSEIDEKELTERAKASSFSEFIPINDLVGKRQNHLLGREIDRIRKILWDLVTTGAFTVPDETGAQKHLGAFPLTTLSTSTGIPWSTRGTAVPYADFAQIPLLARGQSADFGGGATAVMNRVTYNNLSLNANPADLFGRRTRYGETYNSIGAVNEYLKGQTDGSDLPEIRIYDKGYKSDGKEPGRQANVWYPFIPNGKVVIFGKRQSNALTGEYRYCRNVNNPDQGAGSYNYVRDLTVVRVPKKIVVERGHNGGPVIYFPGSIIIMSV